MKVTVEGLEEQKARLRGMSSRLRDLSPVMQVAASDTYTLIDDSFAGSRSPSDAPWAKHSPATTKIRARRGRSGNVLIDAGRLRSGITATSDARSFSFGTNVSYGGYHQLGASIRVFGKAPAVIPARPFLPVEGSRGAWRLMNTGAAGRHWTEVRTMFRKYITTGEL